MGKIVFSNELASTEGGDGTVLPSSVRLSANADQEKHPAQAPSQSPGLLIPFRRLLQLPILLGFFGGALLAGGAYAPLIHIPILGNLSYLRHPAYFTTCTIGEIVLLATATLSVISALLKRLKMLWLTGTVAIAQLIITVVIFQHDAAAVVAKADQPDLVDPIVMWAGSCLRHSRFEWGIAVVAIGAMMVLAAALCDGRHWSKRNETPEAECEKI